MSISVCLFFAFQIIFTFQSSTPASAGCDHSGFREIISIGKEPGTQNGDTVSSGCVPISRRLIYAHEVCGRTQELMKGWRMPYCPEKRKTETTRFCCSSCIVCPRSLKLIYHIPFRPAIRFENENAKSQNIVIFYQRIAGFPKKVVLRC